jgi:hypothetical protein
MKIQTLGLDICSGYNQNILMFPTCVRDEARFDDPQGQHRVGKGQDARRRRDVLRSIVGPKKVELKQNGTYCVGVGPKKSSTKWPQFS